MKRTLILTLAAGAMLAVSMADARPGGRLRDRLGGGGPDATAPQPTQKQTMAYGQHSLQELDFYPPANGNRRAPLIVFVHGGGWKRGSKDNADGSWKAPHYTASGYAYASINYRLVPEATVEQQGADVAAALRFLLDRAGPLGIDRTRVVIMGHSAGAHLVALVGTDEQYLKGAGLSLRDIDGVLPIDGAAYDVAAQMKDGGRMMQDTYTQAFGTDPARQAALSPTLQAGAPNAASFLIIHVQRRDGVAQAKALQEALRKAGTPTERRDFPGTGLTGHAEINRQLGNPDYAATPVVDDWLGRVFRR